ncbi:MAG: FMN-binding protein [Nitrospiraceae bacterium]|nr:FMN-binding protein [Nitrospiraceae bacterium]
MKYWSTENHGEAKWGKNASITNTKGKNAEDPIRINRDIINISGATMSVRSMSAGVKRALVLAHELYLQTQSQPLPSIRPVERQKFLESLLGF